jgi:hypothetical protein
MHVAPAQERRDLREFPLAPDERGPLHGQRRRGARRRRLDRDIAGPRLAGSGGWPLPPPDLLDQGLHCRRRPDARFLREQRGELIGAPQRLGPPSLRFEQHEDLPLGRFLQRVSGQPALRPTQRALQVAQHAQQLAEAQAQLTPTALHSLADRRGPAVCTLLGQRRALHRRERRLQPGDVASASSSKRTRSTSHAWAGLSSTHCCSSNTTGASSGSALRSRRSRSRRLAPAASGLESG